MGEVRRGPAPLIADTVLQLAGSSLPVFGEGIPRRIVGVYLFAASIRLAHLYGPEGGDGPDFDRIAAVDKVVR